MDNMPPCATDREWTRTEMLLYGGTSWFSIYIAACFVNTGTAILRDCEMQTKYEVGCWMGILQIFIGAMMFLGLFIRPAWRDWKWTTIVSVGFGIELAYFSQLQIASYSRAELADELLFTVMVGVLLFLSVLNQLVRHEIKRRCAHSPSPRKR